MESSLGGESLYGALSDIRGFNFFKYIRQPLTIVRLLSLVFALTVFACITTEGYINKPESPDAKCVFNQNDSACQYAVSIGVMAFLACIGFITMDLYLPFMSNAQDRKYAVMADLLFSWVWAALWFVCFCLLANQWGQTLDVRGIPLDGARATIAFSFFSMVTWGILAYYALGRFRRGNGDVTLPTYVEPRQDHRTPYPPTYAPSAYNPTPYAPTTYAAYPDMPDMLQQSPYPQPQGEAAYQPPTY